jgi:hypothetical protein
MVSGGVTRCLLELALASNAPNGLKSQALNTLTPILTSSVPNQSLLSSLVLSPLVPVQADEEHPNGGFVRLPPRPAVASLVSIVVDGDPSAGGRGLRCRAAGVNMFEVSYHPLTRSDSQAYVTANDDARIDIITSLSAPPPSPEEEYQLVGAIIMSGLLDLPTSPEAPFDPYRSLFSCLLLAHLFRNSEHAKKLAREVTIASADGDAADDDDKVGLVQLVVGNLMMAAREQTECVNRAAKEGKVPGSTEEEDWTRVMVGYLVLLCTWLWDSPKTVKEFLSESANLQVVRRFGQSSRVLLISSSFSPSPKPRGLTRLCKGFLHSCWVFVTSSIANPGRSRGTLCTLSSTLGLALTSLSRAWRDCGRTQDSGLSNLMRSRTRQVLQRARIRCLSSRRIWRRV